MVQPVRRRSALAVVAIAALAFGLAACGSDSEESAGSNVSASPAAAGTSDVNGGSGGDGTAEAPSGAAPEVEGAHGWGFTGPQSGALAAYGEYMGNGIASYVEATNAAGGADGHQIDLNSLDNASDSSRTAVNTTQLITSEQASLVITAPTSAVCSSALPIAQRNKTPLLCYAVADTTEDYVFTYGPQHEMLGEVSLQSAKEIVGETDGPLSLALVYLNTQTTVQWADTIKQTAADNGAEVVIDEKMDLTAVDLSAIAAKVISAKPDIILWEGVPVALTGFLKTLRTGGLDAPLLSVDGASAFEGAHANQDENVYFMQPFKVVDPQTATGAGKEYVDAIIELTGKDDFLTLNQVLSVQAYIGARAAGEAAAACGYPCSGEDLRNQLSTLKFDMDGLSPGFSYSNREDNYPYSTFFLYHVTADGAEELTTLPLN